MAEFTIYKDNEVDMTGYKLLSTAICHQAYEDLVEALKRVHTLNRTTHNQSTLHKLERIIAEGVAHQSKSSLQYGYAHMDRMREGYMNYAKSTAEREVEKLLKFFSSDQFALFAPGIDPQVVFDQANRVVSKWEKDRTQAMKTKRNFAREKES